jgi:hypothetical protein
MGFEIFKDENGNPNSVHTWDGFMETSRPFDKERDGWMLDQLDPNDFPAIQIGRDMEYLVNEVNILRRQLFILKGK